MKHFLTISEYTELSEKILEVADTLYRLQIIDKELHSKFLLANISVNLDLEDLKQKLQVLT